MRTVQIIICLFLCVCLFPGWEGDSTDPELPLGVSKEETTIDPPAAPNGINQTLVSARIAFIVVDTTPSGGSDDAQIKSDLEAMGHTVTYVSHNNINLTTFDNNYDLAIVSESASSTTIGTSLTAWGQPIGTMERGLLDDFGMGGGQSQITISQIKITNSSSLLAGGYANGNQTLSGSVGNATTSGLASGAEVIATWPNNNTRSIIVALPQGATTTSGGSADGTRVFWGPGTNGIITSAVWDDLFEGLVDYLVAEANLQNPPDKVENLVATGGDNEIDLSWSAPNDNGSAITGYKVEYRIEGNTSWILSGTVSTTSTTITGLSDETIYETRVTAENQFGSGPNSDITLVITDIPDPNLPAMDIAFIVGNVSPSPSSQDAFLKAKMEALGHNVTYEAPANINLMTYSSNYDFAIISETVINGDVDTALNAWEKPVGTFETGMLSRWDLGVNQSKVTVSSIQMGTKTTTLNGGLDAGNAAMDGSVGYATISQLAPDAKVVATQVTDNTRAHIFYILKGEDLLNSEVASGTRVWWGLAAEDGLPTSIFYDNLFDGMIAFLGTEANTQSPPDPVQNLVAVGGQNEIDLSWSVPNDNGSPITGYNIEYRVSGTSSWTPTSVGTVTSTTISSLADETTYEIRITAINASGSSLVSDTILAVTYIADPNLPAMNIAFIVGDLTPSPGSQDAFLKTKMEDLGHVVTYELATSINLSTYDANYDFAIVSESVDNNQVGTQLNGWERPIATFETGLLNRWDLGVNQSKDSVYTIKMGPKTTSLNGGLNQGEVTFVDSLGYAVVPLLAADVEIVAYHPTDSTRAHILYVLEGDNLLDSEIAAGMRVWWGLAAIDRIPPSVYFDNLFRGLIAFLGNEALNNSQGPVENLIASPSSSTVTLTWDAPGNSTATFNYEIEYKLSSASTWISSGTQTQDSITISSLTNGSPYDFRVRVEPDTSTINEPWVEVSATPGIPVEGPVVNLQADAQDEQVSLSWSAPAGATPPLTYEIEYKLNSASTWTSEMPQTGTSILITGLTNDSQYNFRVRVEPASPSVNEPWLQVNATPTDLSYPVSSVFPSSLTPVVPGYYGIAHDIDIHPNDSSTVYVLEVDRLNGNISSTSGSGNKGSFPYCIDRAQTLKGSNVYIYIVFSVSGVIELSGGNQHKWENLERTVITGATAKGPVFIYGMENRPVNCKDVLVTHLAFANGTDEEDTDAVWQNNCTNMVWKNCFFGYATDENVSHSESSITRIAYIQCLIAHAFETFDGADARRGKGGLQNDKKANGDKQLAAVNTAFMYNAERNFYSRHSALYYNVVGISSGSKFIDISKAQNNNAQSPVNLYAKNIYAFDNDNVISGNPNRSNSNGSNNKPVYVQGNISQVNGEIFADSLYYKNYPNRTKLQNIKGPGAGNLTTLSELAFLAAKFDSVDLTTIPEYTRDALAAHVIDNAGPFATHSKEATFQVDIKDDYDNPTGTGNYVTVDQEVPELDDWTVPTITSETGFRIAKPTASDRFDKDGAGGDGRFSEFEKYLFITLETSELY